MAIISSDELELTNVDDGDDGYSPQVTVTTNTQDNDSIDINVTSKDNTTGQITTTTEATIKKADKIYTALQDVTVFNQLTNGGELQGMFVDENGRAYFNGTYLKAEGATIGGYEIGADFMSIGNATNKTDIVQEYAEHTVESEYEGRPNITVGGITYSGDGGIEHDLGSFFEVYMKDSIDDRATADSHNRLRIEPRRTEVSGGWSNDNSNTHFTTTRWGDDEIYSEVFSGNGVENTMEFNTNGLYVDGIPIGAPAEEILTFGNYNTLNTDITLSKPYTDFRFIMFRFGGGGGEGTVHIIVPTNSIFDGTNYSSHQAVWYVISNNNPVVGFATVKFTAPKKIQITSKTGGGTNVLRQVKGIY